MEAGYADQPAALLELWRSGDELERSLLARGLEKSAVPQLHALGRAVVGVTLAREAWDEERVRQVCGLLDQVRRAEFAADWRRHAAQRGKVLRNLGRMEGGRRRLLEWLFPS
jgi:hypothetical protein